MMNNGLSQGSAKIYQFPVGGRAALAGLLQRQPDENLGELVEVGAFAVDGPDGERTLLVGATVGLLGVAAHRSTDPHRQQGWRRTRLRPPGACGLA